MQQVQNRQYPISKVSDITGVSPYTLRRWETLFSQLNPKRNRAGRRCYTDDDIELIRRIKYHLRHEGMTAEGAERRLAEEKHGEGPPRTRKQARDLLEKIHSEVRAMLDLLGPAESLGSE